MADLIYEVHNHLARITLNRPKQLNCFSEEMIRLWTEALEDVRDNDDVYALLLSGNGKAFCAGVPVLTWLSCAMCGSPGRVLPCRKAILMPELYLVTAEHISCPVSSAGTKL